MTLPQRSSLISSQQPESLTALGDEHSQLKFAMLAIMTSMHPMLDQHLESKAFDPEDSAMLDSHDNEEVEGENRQAWLKRVKERDRLCNESSRLTSLLRLFWYMRIVKAPGHRIVIFSFSLKFLAIVRGNSSNISDQMHQIRQFCEPKGQKRCSGKVADPKPPPSRPALLQVVLHLFT